MFIHNIQSGTLGAEVRKRLQKQLIESCPKLRPYDPKQIGKHVELQNPTNIKEELSAHRNESAMMMWHINMIIMVLTGIMHDMSISLLRNNHTSEHLIMFLGIFRCSKFPE